MARAGTLVGVGAGSSRLVPLLVGLADAMVRSRLLKQRVKFFLARTNRADLLVLRDLAAAGKLRPAIERTYPLSQVGDAMRAIESGQVAGKVVVTLDR